MRYMFMPLRRYFDFQGRSRRMEFWMFALFLFGVVLLFNLLFLAFFMGAIMNAVREHAYAGSGAYSRYDLDSGFEQGFQISMPPELLLDAIGPVGIAFVLGYLMCWLVMFVPVLAVQIRRLHDTDRTGWWAVVPTLSYLLGLGLLSLGFLNPEVGLATAMLSALLLVTGAVCALILLIFMFMEGTHGPNRFGPDPKGADVTRTFA